MCLLPPGLAGEMVLLLHWSLLNYAALAKILKKHGALLLWWLDGRGQSLYLSSLVFGDGMMTLLVQWLPPRPGSACEQGRMCLVRAVCWPCCAC